MADTHLVQVLDTNTANLFSAGEAAATPTNALTVHDAIPLEGNASHF